MAGEDMLGIVDAFAILDQAVGRDFQVELDCARPCEPAGVNAEVKCYVEPKQTVSPKEPRLQRRIPRLPSVFQGSALEHGVDPAVRRYDKIAQGIFGEGRNDVL